MTISPFDLTLRPRVVFGAGTAERLGEFTRELGLSRVLLVSDAGVVAAGHVDRAVEVLTASGIETVRFREFSSNPDSRMVEAGRRFAAAQNIDGIIGLGGGSALDCAKGINFVLTNGGTMADYRGHGKASRPMLPMIGVPTTAGTGSDAQSYAIISDPDTHAKMACGDPKAAFRVAVLDPLLTLSQPRELSAVAGIDALSHAVEAYVTTKGTDVSRMFAREAFTLLERNYGVVLEHPSDLDARSAMLLGAHWAGAAIEQSMLGATHACANPLTARYGIAHGVAIAVMLPHVVRWNAEVVDGRYAELLHAAGMVAGPSPGEQLARRLDDLAAAAGLPRTLGSLGVEAHAIPGLATEAEAQWTGKHNPRPLDRAAASALYQRAL